MITLGLLITRQIVPEAFVVPVSHETATDRLESLRPKLVKADEAAYTMRLTKAGFDRAFDAVLFAVEDPRRETGVQ